MILPWSVEVIPVEVVPANMKLKRLTLLQLATFSLLLKQFAEVSPTLTWLELLQEVEQQWETVWGPALQKLQLSCN